MKTVFWMIFLGVGLASVGVGAVCAATPVEKPPEPNYDVSIQAAPVAIDATKNLVHFEVVVKPRAAPITHTAAGVLEVFDETGRIVAANIQGIPGDKVLVYQFDISRKYLPKSRFAFKATGEDTKGTVTADVVWFKLANYAN